METEAGLGIEPAAAKLHMGRGCATGAIGGELDRRTRGKLSGGSPTMNTAARRSLATAVNGQRGEVLRGERRASYFVGGEKSSAAEKKGESKTACICCGGKPAFEGGTLPNVDEERRHGGGGLEHHRALPSRRID